MVAPGAHDKHQRREPNTGIHGLGARPPNAAEAAKHLDRDFPFAALRPAPRALPPRVMLPTWANQDQNGRGACASFAMLRIAMCERGRVFGTDTVYDPSEEALYVQNNIDTNTPCQDGGAWPGTLADIIVKKGIVGEWYLPYMSTNLCGPLSDEIRQAMAAERGVLYATCPDDGQIKAAIASGHRVCACFDLHASFDHLLHRADGWLEMPRPAGGILGGHAMDFYGYDDGLATAMGTGAFIMQNQWGYDTPIVVPYQLCALGGWQTGAGGLWYDATYTITGWNGQTDPQPAPNPEPEPTPTPASWEKVKPQVMELIGILGKSVQEIPT